MVEIWDIFNQLTQIPVQIAALLLYPIFQLIDTLVFLLNIVYSAFALLLNSVIAAGNLVINTITQILSNFLPTPWISLCVMIIVVIVALRAYSFIKGLTILGNRIGG